MTAACRLFLTTLIAMFLSPALVGRGLRQTGIKNGGTVYVTAGSNAELQWSYPLPAGITPLFQTWRKLPDTGIASRTNIVYISQAYQGRVELFGDSGLRLLNVTTADSGTYQLYMVSSDGASLTLELILQVVAVPETTPESTLSTTAAPTTTTTQSTTTPIQGLTTTLPTVTQGTSTQATTVTAVVTLPTLPTIATTVVTNKPTTQTQTAPTQTGTTTQSVTATQASTTSPKPVTMTQVVTATPFSTTTQAVTTVTLPLATTNTPTATTTQATSPTTVLTTRPSTTATPVNTTPVATPSTGPTNPVVTMAPPTTLPAENDLYVPDDGITEVISGGAAWLNWAYSLRPGSRVIHEEVWNDHGIIIFRLPDWDIVRPDDVYKGRASLIGDSSLLLNGTGPADAGNYTLKAIFSDDNGLRSAERQLIVLYAPTVPQITITPGPTVTEGDTMELQATADCFPPATFTWSRLDGTLPTTAVVNATLGTLTITGVTLEDSGTYTVVAGNYLGNSSVKNVTVQVGLKPTLVAVAAVPPLGATTEGPHTTPTPATSSGQLEIVLIVLGSTLVVAILLVGGLRCWWVKKKRARTERQNGRWYFHPFILDRVYPLEQPPPPVPARPQFLKYEVDRNDLELREQIGRGAFGVVHLATLRRTPDGLVTDRTVVVKTVHDGASEEEKATFVREIETTINLGEHKNLLGLVGCCTLANPPYLVTEYLPYGDLKNFLLKCRQPLANVLNSVYDMTELKMYQIGRQIANGMVFISEAGYVHGDLAARNVLVGEKLVVKIADFGLATDVYERGYQRQDAEQKIPVRWMAPERLLREGRYTSKSDVWSFGVVLYEIATLGDVPYPSLGTTLLEELRRGRREQRPEECPWELYNMMLSCWQWDEFSRPGFPQLYLELDRLVETHADVSYLKLPSASSDDERSSGIFTDSQSSSRQNLDTPSTSGTSQATKDLQESYQATEDLQEIRDKTSQASKIGRRSKEAKDVTIGQVENYRTNLKQIQTKKRVSKKLARKNNWLKEDNEDSTSTSVEVQFVDPRRLSGRPKIGADSNVYYKVPPKNSQRKQRQASGKFIGEEQIEVLDLESDIIESAV